MCVCVCVCVCVTMTTDIVENICGDKKDGRDIRDMLMLVVFVDVKDGKKDT